MGFRRRYTMGALAAYVLLCLAAASLAQEEEGVPGSLKGREQVGALANLPIVVLDPGHGGPDAGVVSPSGLTEAEVVWTVASRLKSLLEGERVARVVLTRSIDRNPSLAERTALANRREASLFVSLHVGAAFHPEVKGASVYLASEPGRSGGLVLNGGPREPFRPTRRKAKPKRSSPVRWEAVQVPHRRASRRACAAILEAFTKEGVVEARGLHEADLPLLQSSAMPACLVEIATLSYPVEEAALRQDSTNQALVGVLFQGVRAALGAGR